MCFHLNVSQFYAYGPMTLCDECVNVMEIAFGLVDANGSPKRCSLSLTLADMRKMFTQEVEKRMTQKSNKKNHGNVLYILGHSQ